MDSLTMIFNAQAFWWSVNIAPLLMMLILDDIAARRASRRERILNLKRDFWQAAQADARSRYQRQSAPQPRRMPGPRL